MKNNTPIIIAGMHRAGTSMLTREIEKLGVFLGNDLEKNHESIFFKSINEKLINDSGGNWDNPQAIKWLFNSPDVIACYEKYFKLMTKSLARYKYDNFKNHELWGWKDPRNTFTFPFWKNIYPKAKLIIIERHGLDVALSLVKRREEYLQYNTSELDSRSLLYKVFGKRGTFVDTMRSNSLASALELWDEYTGQARVLLDNYDDVLFLKYENFLLEPENEMKKVANFLQLSEIKCDYSNIISSRAFAYKNQELEGFIDLGMVNELLSKYDYEY
ncbi:sulfotransferase [Pseudoalteromonas sp. UCD-33C]|uniref:sulfotransferase n=1 Tax=Pseudoalteromonas sp. UCD-33C TaxID=1716175 RepID=UPI0006CA3962|nr:sulfotransferase [Pseudoalteromonas sp. UCD-33C]KPM75457.1 hypothetical protein AOG26_16850 [Pseudoalteromonas sp. UCD-33C]